MSGEQGEEGRVNQRTKTNKRKRSEDGFWWRLWADERAKERRLSDETGRDQKQSSKEGGSERNLEKEDPEGRDSRTEAPSLAGSYFRRPSKLFLWLIGI